MRLRHAWAALGLLLAAGAAAGSFERLDRARFGRPAGAQVLYLPSGKYLKATSLGFPELMADVIYIWSIQYYSNYEAADRFKYLEHIYGNVIAELDPHYIDPYLIGSLIMSVEAGEHEMGLRLLDKGIAANPGVWILPFEAGFTCYNVLMDYDRAARYFETALAAPGAPGVIRRLRAEMYNKMGDKRSSLEYWREVHETADNDYVRHVSWRHVHDLTIEVDLATLRAALAAFRDRAGRPPPSLEALAESGLIARVPVDPQGRAYLYDPRTGEVRSRTRLELRRRGGS